MMFRALLGLALVVGAWATCHTSENDCGFQYGAWSDCDPCTSVNSRHINITAPPHFDGFPCPSNLLEYNTCKPNKPCPANLPCPGQFDCQLIGKEIPTQCINDSLVCNGQQDCVNNADEMNCSASEQFSRAELECMNMDSVPYLDQIGSGVHVTSGDLMGKVVDNTRFNGYCRKAMDGDVKKVYRLPFNVNNFHFHVKSSDSLVVSTFDSLQSYSNEKDKESSYDWSQTASAHGAFGAFSFKVDESLSYSHSDSWKQIFTGMKDTNSVLFRVGAQVEVAQFIMKGENLLLDSFMEENINKLPVDYNAKPYMDFFDQYGVFYLHGGTLGGTYEHNYIFSQQKLADTAHTTTTMKQCLKFSISASLGYGGFGGSASYGFDKCKNANSDSQSSHSVAEMAQTKVVHIDGGTSEAAGALVGAAFQGNASFSTTKYQAWVQGVTQNPVLLSRTYRPVCDLIFSAHSANLPAKYTNCMQAAEAYVSPWTAAACGGCKNGGRSVNMGGQCQCVCTVGYEGQACAEQTQEAGFVKAYEFVTGKPLRRTRNPASKERKRFMNQATQESLSSHSDIKILTSGHPPVAVNPPHMNKLPVGLYDNTLKNKEDKVYYIQSSNGVFLNKYGHYTGSFSVIVSSVVLRTRKAGQWIVEELNEYLEALAETPIDFTTITACSDKADFTFCHIKDYDIDVHGNYVLSIQITTSGGKAITSIYTVNTEGKMISMIEQPCVDENKDASLGVYVSTTCGDTVVVSCPGYSPATIKTYTSDGKAQGLTQLAGFDKVTGVQHFNNQVWIHSFANTFAAYDLDTWDQVFNYTTPFQGDSGDAVPYSQLFLDFAGNLIVAQAHDSGHNNGADNYKFSILNTNSKAPLAHIKIADGWNSCRDVATYRGKLFTLCEQTSPSTEKAILVFDYLK